MFLFVVIPGSPSSDRLDLHDVDDFQVSFKIYNFLRNFNCWFTLKAWAKHPSLA